MLLVKGSVKEYVAEKLTFELDLIKILQADKKRLLGRENNNVHING